MGDIVWRLFALQETNFEREAPSVTGEGTGGADDAVTGDEAGDRVGRDGASDGADSLRALEMVGELLVGDGLAGGDAEEVLPDTELEGGAMEANGDGGIAEAVKVGGRRPGIPGDGEPEPIGEAEAFVDGAFAKGEPFEAGLPQAEPSGAVLGAERKGRDGEIRRRIRGQRGGPDGVLRIVRVRKKGRNRYCKCSRLHGWF